MTLLSRRSGATRVVSHHTDRASLRLAAVVASSASVAGVIYSTTSAGVFCVVTAFAYPSVALVIAVTVDGYSLPVLLQYPQAFPMLPWIAAALTVVALASVCVNNSEVREKCLRWAPAIVFLALWGTVSGLSQLAPMQIAAGVRFALLPLLVGLVAAGLGDSVIRRILLLCGSLLTVNLVVAIVELFVGTAGLVAAGLQYGGPVRTYESALRPPGIFVANYVFGGFAAVYCVILVGRIVRQGARQSHMTEFAFMMVALACVAVSTSRFALIVLGAGLGCVVLTSASRLRLAPRIVVFSIIGGMAAVFLISGWGSIDSFYARLDLWRELLSKTNFAIGSGWGSAGSATLSRYADGRNTTDNYFLNLVFQLGVGAVVVLMVLVGMIVRKLRLSVTPTEFGGVCALLGLVASFSVTESWEYTSAACLAMLCAGTTDGGATIRNGQS